MAAGTAAGRRRRDSHRAGKFIACSGSASFVEKLVINAHHGGIVPAGTLPDVAAVAAHEGSSQCSWQPPWAGTRQAQLQLDWRSRAASAALRPSQIVSQLGQSSVATWSVGQTNRQFASAGSGSPFANLMDAGSHIAVHSVVTVGHCHSQSVIPCTVSEEAGVPDAVEVGRLRALMFTSNTTMRRATNSMKVRAGESMMIGRPLSGMGSPLKQSKVRRSQTRHVPRCHHALAHPETLAGKPLGIHGVDIDEC